MKYVSFIRGINSGKNPPTKMEVLKTIFESLGFTEVKAILASGNLIFETTSTKEAILERQIETALPSATKADTIAIVLKFDKLQQLALINPFVKMGQTASQSPFVTFLKHPPKAELSLIGKGYKILFFHGRAIFSLVDLSGATNPELMKVLDKTFGNGNTTRSWKTIERILKK